MWSGVETFMFCGVDTRYSLKSTNVKQDAWPVSSPYWKQVSQLMFAKIDKDTKNAVVCKESPQAEVKFIF